MHKFEVRSISFTAEDAVLAVNNGVSGIIVSNHGARQLDGVPATVSLFHLFIHTLS